MKNPFKKEDKSGLWIAVLFGALAAGTVTYLYITKNGAKVKKKLSDASDEVQQHATDYLKAKTGRPKKHKSDIHDLEHLAHTHHEG